VAQLLDSAIRNYPLDIDYIRQFIPLLANLILVKDTETQLTILVCCTMIIQDDIPDHTNTFVEMFPLTRIIRFLSTKTYNLRNEAMTIITLISSGSIENTRKLLSASPLASIKKILLNDNEMEINNKSMAFETIGQICAAEASEIQQIIDHDIFPILFKEILGNTSSNNDVSSSNLLSLSFNPSNPSDPPALPKNQTIHQQQPASIPTEDITYDSIVDVDVDEDVIEVETIPRKRARSVSSVSAPSPVSKKQKKTKNSNSPSPSPKKPTSKSTSFDCRNPIKVQSALAVSYTIPGANDKQIDYLLTIDLIRFLDHCLCLFLKNTDVYDELISAVDNLLIKLEETQKLKKLINMLRSSNHYKRISNHRKVTSDNEIISSIGRILKAVVDD
jgi:hypothetical protein